jgi:uncharacterized integral membrane protein
MSTNRFILLLVTLSLIAILVAANWSIKLPLSFLGMQTRSLPLGIWLLVGLTTGIVTSSILQSLNYFLRILESRKSDRLPKRPPSRPPLYNNPPKDSHRASPQNKDWDSDWQAEPPQESEDWDFDEDSEDPPPPEPNSKNVSGSVYSYSYRQPENTSVGKSEAVREANYRVINPPNRPYPEDPADEDDWGFDLDNEESDRDRR